MLLAFRTHAEGVRPVNATCRIHTPAGTPKGRRGGARERDT
jgi:hypothetical protein